MHLIRNSILLHKPDAFFIGLAFIGFSLLALCPLWQGAAIWDSYENVSDFYNKYERPLDVYLALLSFFIVVKYKLRYQDEFIFLIIFSFFNALSIIINGHTGGYFSIVAIPLIYILLSVSKNTYYYSWNSIIILILLVWIISPIIDCFFFSDFSRQLLFFKEYGGGAFFDAGFSGYALHKNVYAYIIGLCFLVSLFTPMSKWVKYMIWLILLGALILSLCKSVIVTLVAVVLYYKGVPITGGFKFSIKHKFVIAIFLSLAIVLFFKLSFFNDPNRTAIINGFLGVIKNHFLFGTGEATVVPTRYGDDMMPAHNLILQGIADRGIIAFVFYCFFVRCFFNNSDKTYRLFLLYMLLNGLFQPYYTIGIPNYLMMVTFLLPLFLKVSK